MTRRIPFNTLILPAACALLAGSLPQAALAATIIPAFDNATSQPGGPRAGANGKNFFNVEGSSNGSFSSFGVADFQTPAGVTFGPGGVLSLTLTQSNAAFTNNGSLQFFLSTDTAASIQPGVSPVVFNSAALPTGLGAQLATTYMLGSGTFTQVATGQMDTFSFTPSGAALSYLTTEIGAAGKIRLIVVPGDATVAATYAGFSNSNTLTPGPILTIATVPEPSTWIFMTTGLLLVVSLKRIRGYFDIAG